MGDKVDFPDRGGKGFCLLLTRRQRIGHLYDAIHDARTEVEFAGSQAYAMSDINCAVVLLMQLNQRKDYGLMVRLKFARKNIKLIRRKTSILESLEICMKIVSKWTPKQYSKLDLLLERVM